MGDYEQCRSRCYATRHRFKRRWSFKYFSIDQAVDEDIFETFCKVNLPNNQQIQWNDIRVFINDLLSQLNVPEDKLLGPYFISKNTNFF